MLFVCVCVCVCVCALLGIELGALGMLVKHSTTELHPEHCMFTYKVWSCDIDQDLFEELHVNKWLHP